MGKIHERIQLFFSIFYIILIVYSVSKHTIYRIITKINYSTHHSTISIDLTK